MTVMNLVYPLVYRHASWDPQSRIIFRRDISIDDYRAVSERAEETGAQGEDLHRNMIVELIVQQGKRWEGPEFLVPDDYLCDPDSEEGKAQIEAGHTILIDGDVYPLHPLCGQPQPFTRPWIALQAPWELMAIKEWADHQYALPTEEELDSFRARHRPAASSQAPKHEPGAGRKRKA